MTDGALVICLISSSLSVVLPWLYGGAGYYTCNLVGQLNVTPVFCVSETLEGEANLANCTVMDGVIGIHFLV